MKKLLLIFAFLFIGLSQSFAQTVPQQQRSLLTKVTATWCPHCGSWGWEMFEGVLEENQDKAVMIATHYSGDLLNPTAEAVANNLNPPYQPRFYLGNVEQGVTSSNVASKLVEVKDAIDANFLTEPVANAGIDAFRTGDQLQVNTKTKFFQDADGEYYLGVYVIEDEVVNNQAGNSSTAVHKKIMRASVNGEHFGELLMNGSIAADTEFDHTFTMTLNPAWNTDNLEIVTIIWKKEASTYQFVNTNTTDQFSEILSTHTVALEGAAMKIQPTIINTEATITIDLEKDLPNANLSIFDSSGRKVMELFNGDLKASNNSFTINKHLMDAPGIYFVVLLANQKTMTRKIILE